MSPRAMRRPGLGALDRALRALVGLVGGTVVGGLIAGALGTALAPWLPVPRAWGTWVACAGGVLGAALLASRDVAPWIRAPRRGGVRAFRHGWVDVVFRAAIGVVAGAFGGILSALALTTWLDVVLPAWRGWYDADELFWDTEAWTLVVLGTFGGAGAGLVWFALDLPWLPGRRTWRGPGAGTRIA
jgi:hypothetical protein